MIMKKTRSRRFLSLLLCVMMVLSIVPITAFAATSFTQSQLSVVSDKQSKLADGVAEDLYTVYDKNGKQVKLYAATVDSTVDTVKILTSYKDMDNSTYGMSKLTEQVAAFDKKAAAGDEYYTGTVVAGINASYYNMTTGKPSGVFVMNGNDVTGSERSAYFAVMKDGSVKIGKSAEYDADKGNIQEAIGIYKMLVYDGNIELSASDQANTQKYPRQTIGITADGKVILLSADGNQEPTSIGLTLMEQAQVMLDLGCVYAGHLDGGGSMTYGSKPEGEDSFKIVNRPSDGSERSISNGLIIVSTAAPSDVFDHVTMSANDEYVTPGTSTEVTVTGVSPAGTSAEIPSDVTYSVTNGTYENGVLTATAEGDVVLTAKYNGNDVGSLTIHAVVPEKIAFVNTNMTVPFEKTVALNITATYGINSVKFKASDFTFTLENAGIGTVDGLNFTAGDGSVTSSKLTATVTGTEVSAEATINLGKGSVVLWDFEDGNVSEFRRAAASKYNYIIAPGSCSLVTAETGKVHSGKYAMKFNTDFSVSLESGYMNARLCVKNKSGGRIDLKDATRIGMWIYFPVEAKSLNGRVFLQAVTARNEDGSIKSVSNSYTTATLIDDGGDWNCGFVTQYDEPGWHYVYFDLSGGDWCIPADWTMLDMYINDRDGSSYNYYHQNYKSQNSNIVMYLDDITVDYSSAVDDRDAPVFSNVRWADTTMSDAATFTRGTTAQASSNTVSFSASVADKVKDNATGLDESTAKAYIDGVEVAGTFKDGSISVADCVLADGIHTVKFSICDNQGNYASVIRKINISTGSGKSTIKLMPHDATINNILLGSVYYMDLVATDIEKVQSVSADIDLNNMSNWELDHMVVADGFEASYVISDSGENIATITVTRVGDTDATGEGMLVSMPVRTWELPAFVADGGLRSNVWMYPEYKSGNEVWPIDISASVIRGEVTFTDSTNDTFTGAEVQVDTEAKNWGNITKTSDYSAWNGGHDHRAETKQYYSDTATNHVDAVALADKAATCTEAGYTGRTYCEVCSSVVDWGTTVPAKGHSYALADDTLKCSDCGVLYSGEWTDGKTYVDGKVIADGWVDNSYYKDGVKLTGLQKVDGYYYDFGEDGVCANKAKVDGFFYDESVKAYRYFAAGTMMTGDVSIYPEAYFFDANGIAISGKVDVLGYTCYFTEKGAFEKSDDASVVDAGYSGTNIQYVLLKDGTLKIDGEGAVRDYESSGIHPAWIVQNDSKAITSLVVGNSITKIGKFCFFRTPYLKKITFEENSSLETIGWGAFGHCWRLEAVTLPASLTTLDSYAFYECGALTTVDFEADSKLTTINYGAFLHGLGLESVYIPETVTKIGADVFYKANSDMVLKVARGSVGHSYAVNNNLKFELRDGTIIAIEKGSVNDNISWALYSDGTLELSGTGAMPNYTSHTQQPWAASRNDISKVVVGKDITTVGNYAFAYCQNNAAVEFEEGSKVTTIGVLAFFNNPKLAEVTLPETVTYVSSYAFGDCFALTNVYIPQGVSGIYKTAFSNSSKVVLSVAKGTYSETFVTENNINHVVRDFVYIPIASGSCGENATWEMYENGELWIKGSGAMSNYTSHTQQPWAKYRHMIKKIVIGKDITTVGNYAFCYCQNNTAVEFEEGSKITTIGVLSFFNNPKLTEITLPETVTYISSYALGDCFALTDVYIPQGVSGIYKTAFTNSSKVVLNVSKGTYSENFAKEHNVKYTARDFVYIAIASGSCGENATWEMYENGELWIKGSGAMSNYTSHTQQPWAKYRHMIKKIVIGKDITTVGNYAFCYCQNNTAVEFEEGSKITTIGVLSFFNNPKLAEVILPETTTYVSSYAFGDCFALTNVYIPQGVSGIYKTAFSNSSKVVLNVAKDSFGETFAEEHNIDYTTRG